MVCPSTPGAPLLALTRRYASHTSHFEISNDFPCDTDLPTRFLPGTLVDQTDNPRWSGPFAPPPLQGLHHYYEPVRQHAPRRYSTPHSLPGRPGALLRPAPLRTGLARFPRIRLKQARADPLQQTPYVLLDGPPTDGVPVQGFVLRSVHHGVSGKHRRWLRRHGVQLALRFRLRCQCFHTGSPNRGYRADNMTGSVPGSRRWMSTLSYLDLES